LDNKKYAVILAAGDGKRMKSDKPKVLAEVLFQPMLRWVLDAVKHAGVDNTAVIVGAHKEQVTAYLDTLGEYPAFEQKERLGTGHAVMQAKSFIEKAQAENADILVAYGDAPFIDADTITGSYEYHKNSGNDVTVVSAIVDNPTGYGRIIKENDTFKAIVEQKDCDSEQAKVREINSGIYWFKAEKLSGLLDKLGNNNAAGEYYLTDTVAVAEKKGVYTADSTDVVLGANSRSQLAALNEVARKRKLAELMDEGVDIPLSDGIIIGKDVKIGHDTVILPNTIIKGKTVIGNGCEIGPNSYIADCVIEDNVILNNVQAHESKVDSKAKAGPFVHLRPNTHLHSGVKIGDFVEVKNSEIGINTCIAHLTYVGDSDVGKGVNFGCGCVTANYDGIKKYRTTIGDNAFIGCNTNMIAPVTIGDNATTAAGSTITKNVPADSLAVERGQTRIIEHWEKNSKRIKKA
jgi:bifunctional UDP-N-acetylglucosamine pyrophosphorylase/glucosamine-1-phosphate N-acetyltransferase